MASTRRVAIIGGGFAGLSAAYHLAKAGVTTHVYEREKTLGGLAGGFSLLGMPLEKAYHFFYKTDRHLLGLAQELGIGDKAAFYQSSVATYYAGKLYPFMTAKDLLAFTPLPLLDRIRFGVTALYLQFLKNWEPLSRITAYEWLKKWAGPKVTEVIWEPLLKGKFNKYYKTIAMSWLWRRIQIRAVSKEKGQAGESQAVDLVFAPLFVTGSYYYAVSLTGANNQALSPTVTLTTLLEGQNQPAIASAHLDKGQYAWSDLAVLTVALTDDTTSNMLKDQGVQLSVMMLDEQGTNCTTLLTQERVTSVTGEYRFKFSPEVSCTNTIRVVLQNDKAETLDEKVLAVALPEREKGPTPTGLKNLASASGVVWAIVAIVILTLAYWLWRRKRA